MNDSLLFVGGLFNSEHIRETQDHPQDCTGRKGDESQKESQKDCLPFFQKHVVNSHHVLNIELGLGNTAPALLGLTVGSVYMCACVHLEEAKGFTESCVLPSQSNFNTNDSWKNQTIG